MNARQKASRAPAAPYGHYPMVVRELSPEEGGGYMASIPQLGSHTFVADGETPAEAVKALEALRGRLLPELLAEGTVLPEPQEEPEMIEQYSGNLVLRIPKSLHAQLAAEAKRSGCSLNKYATQLLAQNMERQWWIDRLQEMLEVGEVALGAPDQTPAGAVASPR